MPSLFVAQIARVVSREEKKCVGLPKTKRISRNGGGGAFGAGARGRQERERGRGCCASLLLW